MTLGAKGVAIATDGAGPKRMGCLGGGPLPGEYAEDARRTVKLSAEAVAGLDAVLVPIVLEPMTRELGDALSQYCLRHEIAEADLGHVLKLCRWVVHEATNVNLSRAELETDLVTLGLPEALAKLLLDRYESLKNTLRERLLAEALRKHGNVLVDVDWRIERVVSERATARLDVPIALLTLRYQSGEDKQRLTLQLSAPELAQLGQLATALAQKLQLAP